MTNDNQNKLLVTGPAAPAGMASVFPDRLVLSADMGNFNSGEPFTEMKANADRLKDADVLLVQSASGDVAAQALFMLMAVHTLRRYGAAEVTVAMPFAPFLRQDRAFDGRFVSLGAEFFASQLKSAGASRVVIAAPHSRASVETYARVFGANNVTVVGTADIFAADIARRFAGKKLAVGAPDGADKPQDEGQHRARELLARVCDNGGDAMPFLISKRHTGVNDTELTGFSGDVAGREGIIVDDMIDGGGTMINAARALRSRGAAGVTCYATHGVFSAGALEKLLMAKTDGGLPLIDRIVITDSMPEAAAKVAALESLFPAARKLVEIVPVAPVLAAALRAAPSAPPGAAGWQQNVGP